MLKFLDQTVYVQIEKDAFSLLHVQTDQKFHLQSPVPFSAQLAVGQLKPAVDILREGLAEVYLDSLFRVSPVVIVHQVYLAEGVPEDRVLRELAFEAGARRVYIWSGPVLSTEQLLAKAYETRP